MVYTYHSKIIKTKLFPKEIRKALLDLKDKKPKTRFTGSETKAIKSETSFEKIKKMETPKE